MTRPKFNKRHLNRNLRKIWDRTTSPVDGEAEYPQSRYEARSMGHGGSGWLVFDRKEDRFLHDHEVAALTPEQIEEDFIS